MTLYYADVSVCARTLIPIEANSVEEAEQIANELCEQKDQHGFLESLRKNLMLCEPEVMDVFKD